MSIIGTYVLSPNEKKFYTVGYGKWLDSAELITGLSWTSDPALSVAMLIDSDKLGINMLVGPGGVDGDEFEVSIRVTTTDTEIKEDCIIFLIEDTCG